MKRLLLAIPLVLALVPGCKGGEGDVCQIDNDCSSPLSCNAGTGRCQQPGGSIVDAAPIVDSAVVDAAADAGPDAGPDAAVDSGVDAS